MGAWACCSAIWGGVLKLMDRFFAGLKRRILEVLYFEKHPILCSSAIGEAAEWPATFFADQQILNPTHF